MESIRIDILNPKAKQLLKDLADLELIKINQEDSSLSDILEQIRSNSKQQITLDEITKEVEAVRKSRYER
ncbi:hypothetical protein [Roseivirga sp.]|uniref:hypothetical protein n=1 Tax=Roseivirga sp. TaxID=1964215 RepID=UPI003B51DC8A